MSSSKDVTDDNATAAKNNDLTVNNITVDISGNEAGLVTFNVMVTNNADSSFIDRHCHEMPAEVKTEVKEELNILNDRSAVEQMVCYSAMRGAICQTLEPSGHEKKIAEKADIETNNTGDLPPDSPSGAPPENPISSQRTLKSWRVFCSCFWPGDRDRNS